MNAASGERCALVVDDSRATRSFLKRMLAGLDFTVAEAGHGGEGLEHLRQHGPPDVVLVDWNMPEMDGLAFIKAVRSDHTYERTVVVMITSENDPTHIVRALTAGADEYAMKPLTQDMLAEKLELAGVLGGQP